MAGEYARKGVGEVAPPSVIPPRHAPRNGCTIIRFDGRWYKRITPVIRHSTAQYDAKSQHHHSFWWAMMQGGYPEGVILSIGQGWWAQQKLPCLDETHTKPYPLGGCTLFNFPRPFPAFGNSVARRGSRLRVAFACIVGENSVKEKWTIDDFRHP